MNSRNYIFPRHILLHKKYFLVSKMVEIFRSCAIGDANKEFLRIIRNIIDLPYGGNIWMVNPPIGSQCISSFSTDRNSALNSLKIH